MANAPLNLPKPTATEAGEDAKAIQEAAILAAGTDLEKQKITNDIAALVRSNSVETHTHRIILCGYYAFAAAMFVLLIVLVLHKVMPDARRFLTPEQVKDVQDWLIAGAIGFATGSWKKSKG